MGIAVSLVLGIVKMVIASLVFLICTAYGLILFLNYLDGYRFAQIIAALKQAQSRLFLSVVILMVLAILSTTLTFTF